MLPKKIDFPDAEEFNRRSVQKRPENQRFLKSLKKKDSRRVDDAFHKVHDAVFDEFDCLTCANCCKTTSPIFYSNDIERVARFLKMKPGAFIDQYLRVDEDNDFVLKSSPCPFLGNDNYCDIYEHRPKACREYPHTRRKKMVQILDLTLRNTMVCPAVFEMVERLKKTYESL